MATPVVRAAEWVHLLPAPLQWYITPAGNHSTFTLFPWGGFVMAGAVTGAIVASSTFDQSESAVARRLAAGGALLVLVCYGFSLASSIYESASFWTTSPTYFGIRVGILMLALALFDALGPLARRLPGLFQALARFGRHSLFVYWIHVELVYGYATVWLHHRLPLWGTAFGYVTFAALMYAAIAMRDRVVGWWQSSRTGSIQSKSIRVDTVA
jgi:uncharacterized membrane protein